MSQELINGAVGIIFFCGKGVGKLAAMYSSMIYRHASARKKSEDENNELR